MTRRPRAQSGFTLLEVLVATLIMGIALGGVLSGISAASRNAARLAQYDRATLLARQKMDELLTDLQLPRNTSLDGTWDAAQSGGVPTTWHATIRPFEFAPGAGPGQWVVDRVELELSWMDGSVQRSFALEGFRRGLLRAGDLRGQQP